MSHILVTGATGLLGSNLVLHLLEQGHEVSVFQRRSSFHPFLAGQPISIRYGDLLDKFSICDALIGIDYVYHVAGFVSYSKWHKDALYRVNVEGTKNILDAALASGVKKVVVTGSTAAVGIPREGEIADETYEFFDRYKKIHYMNSKRQAEDLALLYNNRGLSVVVVSPSTIFGSGDVKMNTGEFIKSIRDEKMPMAPRGGTALVGVKDCVLGHVMAMERGKPGERYILSSENIKMIELINMIADILGVKSIKRVMPVFAVPLAYGAAYVAENVFRHKKFTPALIHFSSRDRYFSSDKAKNDLSWQARQSTQDALVEAIDFYKKNNLI